MEKELISAENAYEISQKTRKKPGAPMKYKTAKALERAIEKYFRSISATVPMAGIDHFPNLLGQSDYPFDLA